MVKDFKISKSLLINYYNQLLVDYEKKRKYRKYIITS